MNSKFWQEEYLLAKSARITYRREWVNFIHKYRKRAWFVSECLAEKSLANYQDKLSDLKACGSITLLKGPHNVLVDTGNPWDKDLILDGLQSMNLDTGDIHYVVCTNGHSDKIGNLNLFTKALQIVSGDVCSRDCYYLHAFRQKNELTPEKIEYVVCTHGHSDHVGNLNLFPHSIHIVSFDICVGDQYSSHGFAQGIPYEIDDYVEVIPTPGHTGSDVSVLVRNTDIGGTVAITGDLFECFEDLENPSLWQDNSEKPETQEQSRIDVLKMADYIVPWAWKNV
ncbi:hypothetical protein KUTeg_012145 [Tegillarca granosa]|uniref:Metallo-beta-lactamase domain-containing protein 1 n=1 Tax=Tegillarca granosa TaxID=220873 RepID=A0ABQ9EYP7_TEGGR|nr:hypothetical protein KUTeg_012145 [Tegillarca granosa]